MSQSKFVTYGLLLFGIAICAGTISVSTVIADPQFRNDEDRTRYKRFITLMNKGPWLLEAENSLPIADDLPDYTVRITGAKGKKRFQATRREDKATLEVSVFATPDVECRNLNCDIAISGSVIGKLPKGSPSGKPLGEQSWQSWGSEPNSKMKTPNYFLQVQDGPAIIRIRLKAYIGQDKKGGAEWTPITQADRLEMERIARLMLRKLAALKLTKATYRG